MKALHVDIVTPSKTAYDGNVRSITIPGTLGNFQVLYNHAPLMSSFEVGQIKKELAYHGDVLNTASRIQGKCNEYKAKLLVSEKLWDKFGAHDKSNFELIGNISLKGKQQPVNIYRYNL